MNYHPLIACPHYPFRVSYWMLYNLSFIWLGDDWLKDEHQDLDNSESSIDFTQCSVIHSNHSNDIIWTACNTVTLALFQRYCNFSALNSHFSHPSIPPEFGDFLLEQIADVRAYNPKLTIWFRHTQATQATVCIWTIAGRWTFFTSNQQRGKFRTVFELPGGWGGSTSQLFSQPP